MCCQLDGKVCLKNRSIAIMKALNLLGHYDARRLVKLIQISKR